MISESRLNLWLGWLRLRFAGLPIVLVLRHPCAVVSSRLLLEKETRLPSLLDNEEFVERYLQPFAHTIESARSQLEKHALMWAIEHYVPLQECPADELHVVQYERFLVEPEAVLEQLTSALGLERRPETGLWRRRIHEHARVVDGWRKHLSADDARRILEIVEAFGLTMYSRRDGEVQPGVTAGRGEAWQVGAQPSPESDSGEHAFGRVLLGALPRRSAGRTRCESAFLRARHRGVEADAVRNQ